MVVEVVTVIVKDLQCTELLVLIVVQVVRFLLNQPAKNQFIVVIVLVVKKIQDQVDLIEVVTQDDLVLVIEGEVETEIEEEIETEKCIQLFVMNVVFEVPPAP